MVVGSHRLTPDCRWICGMCSRLNMPLSSRSKSKERYDISTRTHVEHRLPAHALRLESGMVLAWSCPSCGRRATPLLRCIHTSTPRAFAETTRGCVGLGRANKSSQIVRSRCDILLLLFLPPWATFRVQRSCLLTIRTLSCSVLRWRSR